MQGSIPYLEDCRSPEKVRRGNRDQTAISSTTTATQPSSASNAGNNKQLVIHIVGDATEDDEITDGERLPVAPRDYLTGGL